MNIMQNKHNKDLVMQTKLWVLLCVGIEEGMGNNWKEA